MDTSLNSSQRKSRRSHRRLEEEFGKCDRESIAQRKKSLRYSSGFFSGVTFDQDPHKGEKPHASLWILAYFAIEGRVLRCDFACLPLVVATREDSVKTQKIPCKCHVHLGAGIALFGIDCGYFTSRILVTLRCIVISIVQSNRQFIKKII